MDVADPASVAAGFKAVVETHGRLDILVNNAGITDDGLILRMPKASWDRVIATDLTGVFLASQEAAKVMVRKKVAGRIVNITSVVGLTGIPARPTTLRQRRASSASRKPSRARSARAASP